MKRLLKIVGTGLLLFSTIQIFLNDQTWQHELLQWMSVVGMLMYLMSKSKVVSGELKE